MPKEIEYFSCWGSVFKPCPFGETVKLYNSLHSDKPCGEKVRTVGSGTCTECQYYVKVGRVIEKAGTGWIQSIICGHPKAEQKTCAEEK